MPEEAFREAHLSAERSQAGEAPRFPSPYVGSCRSCGDPPSPAEGPRTALGLKQRIGDRSTFLALRRDGARFRRGPLTLVYLPDGSCEPRFAYAVSRRVGNAVTRNRLRRRLRAAVAHLDVAGKPVAAGAYLFGCSPAAVDLPWPDLTRHVGALVAMAASERTRVAAS